MNRKSRPPHTSVILKACRFSICSKAQKPLRLILKDAHSKLSADGALLNSRQRDSRDACGLYGLLGDLVLDAHAQVNQLQLYSNRSSNPILVCLPRTGTLECMQWVANTIPTD